MILFRYFAREVFVTMLAVTVIVLVISMGWRFSGYLDEAASGTLTKDILFLVMAYRLPGFLELIIPISFFLSVMLVYGRFHVDSEMIVLQSCGMGTTHLVGLTLLLSAFVIVLTASVTLWLKPAGEREVERLFINQQNLTEFDTLVPGRFQSLSTGQRVTYTEKLSTSGELSGVFMNEYRDRGFGLQEVITVVARSGRSEVDAAGDRFLVLKDGARYQGQPGNEDYRVATFEEYGQLVEKFERKTQYHRRTAVPTGDLLLDRTPANLSEFHWRIGMILMVPIIAIMAVPLSKVNPRQGRYNRLVPGMVFCFLYVISMSSARAAIEKGQIPAALGLWWIHAFVLIQVLVLFKLEWFARKFTALIDKGSSRAAT